MSLTDAQVRSAKPRAKEYTLQDERNLFLRVTPEGVRYWIFRYQYSDKQKQISLGRYPSVRLKQAREEAEACRAFLRDGRDPKVARELQKARAHASSLNTFAAVAQQWLDRNGLKPGEVNDKKWSPKNLGKNKSILRRCLLPELGPLPIADITPQMVLAVLKTAQATRGIATAYHAHTACSSVFKFAIAASLVFTNPARDVKAALDPMPSAQHFPALPFEQVGPFLRLLEQADMAPITKAAIRLVMMIGMRDTALRKLQWKHIGEGELFSPAANNKGRVAKRRDFTSPLPTQAQQLLAQLKPLTFDDPDSYVFASYGRSGHLQPCVINDAIKRTAAKLGAVATCHGFRSTLRDWAATNGYSNEVAKTQLAQIVGSSVDQAYLRTDFFEQRAAMLQHYANAIEAAEKNLQPVQATNVRRLARAA